MPATAKIRTFREPALAPPIDEVSLAYPLFQKLQPSTVLCPVLPNEILVGSLGDGRLRVCEPIVVRFVKEGTNVVAEANEFDEFGFGKNQSAALANLQRTIVELFFTLEAEQGRLGPDLQRVWKTLKEKVNKTAIIYDTKKTSV